jgi:hypothetical protein
MILFYHHHHHCVVNKLFKWYVARIESLQSKMHDKVVQVGSGQEFFLPQLSESSDEIEYRMDILRATKDAHVEVV